MQPVTVTVPRPWPGSLAWPQVRGRSFVGSTTGARATLLHAIAAGDRTPTTSPPALGSLRHDACPVVAASHHVEPPSKPQHPVQATRHLTVRSSGPTRISSLHDSILTLQSVFCSSS